MRISKSLKICGGITAFLIISVSITILVLWFTVLKPKQPKITTQQVSLKHMNIDLDPLHVDVTLAMLLNVHNPNRASFNYDNTTSYVTYRGSPAAQASIPQDTIPARGDHSIAAELLLNMDSLVANESFPEDFWGGCLNFTSTTTLHGKARVLNLFKIKATAYSTCHISVYVFTQNSSFDCKSKFKY